MKVTFLKPHTGSKPGVTVDVKDGIGKYLVKMKVAEAAGEFGPKTKKVTKKVTKKATPKKDAPKKSATKKAK